MMSINFEGLITKIKVNAKNTTEVIQGEIEFLSPLPNTCTVKISWVVAAVLGTAKNGPIVKIETVPIKIENFLEIHEVSVVKSIRIYGILTVLNLLVVKFVVWSMVKTLKI